MTDLRGALIAAGCASTQPENKPEPMPEPTKLVDSKGKPMAPKSPRGTTGNFTVHFEVDHRTHDILCALARHRKETPNDVACNVVRAWIENTWRNIENGR